MEVAAGSPGSSTRSSSMAAVWVWFGTIYLTTVVMHVWSPSTGEPQYDNEHVIFEAGDHQTLAVHGTKSPTSAVALADGRYLVTFTVQDSLAMSYTLHGRIIFPDGSFSDVIDFVSTNNVPETDGRIFARGVALADGGFILNIHSDGTIISREYDSQGVAIPFADQGPLRAVREFLLNEPPAVVDDYEIIAEDSGSHSFEVLSNDTDLDGDSLQVVEITLEDPSLLVWPVLVRTAGRLSLNPRQTLMAWQPSATHHVSDGNHLEHGDLDVGDQH